MKSSNEVDGKYFAEILRDVVFKRIASNLSNCSIEPRLSIYGRRRDEWPKLAGWILRHRLFSLDGDGKLSGHVKWIIQIPRCGLPSANACCYYTPPPV
jgi:AMP deaminase